MDRRREEVSGELSLPDANQLCLGATLTFIIINYNASRLDRDLPFSPPASALGCHDVTAGRRGKDGRRRQVSCHCLMRTASRSTSTRRSHLLITFYFCVLYQATPPILTQLEQGRGEEAGSGGSGRFDVSKCVSNIFSILQFY